MNIASSFVSGRTSHDDGLVSMTRVLPLRTINKGNATRGPETFVGRRKVTGPTKTPSWESRAKKDSNH